MEEITGEGGRRDEGEKGRAQREWRREKVVGRRLEKEGGREAGGSREEGRGNRDMGAERTGEEGGRWESWGKTTCQ